MISHATSGSTSSLEQLNAIQVKSISAFTGLFLYIAAQILSLLPVPVQKNKKQNSPTIFVGEVKETAPS